MNKHRMLNDFLSTLSETAFFKLPDDSYEIFNKFVIKKNNDRYKVITSSYERHFNYVKNAVTWCILNKRNMFGEMTALEELDMRLAGIDLEISMHQKLLKTAIGIDDKLLYLDKLNEDTLKKRYIHSQLNKMVNDCKIWQMQRFINPHN